MMNSLNQFETNIKSLATAAKVLADYYRDAGIALDGENFHLAVPPEAPYEVRNARRNVLANLARVQTLVAEPVDFIQHLACQVCYPHHLFVFPSLSRQVVIGAEPRLILALRTNFLHACNGSASSRYWRAYHSVAVSLPKMLQI